MVDVTGAAEPPLAILLGELEDRLRAAGAAIVDHWRPGVRAGRVTAAFEPLGLLPPDELIDWWSWHDGTDIPHPPGFDMAQQAGNSLIGCWFHMGVDDALLLNRGVRETYAEIGYDYPSGWFPFLSFGGTPVLCVDCEPPAGASRPLYLLDGAVGEPPSDQPAKPRFGSIRDFVTTVITLFERGLTLPSKTEPGQIDVDRRRLDPDLPQNYW
jgi:hypothetical protein